LWRAGSERAREDDALEFNSRDPWKIIECVSAEEKKIGKKVECIAMDEGQFVEDLFCFCEGSHGVGYNMLIAGLDLDFRAIPFGEMLDLAWLVNAYGGNITWCVSYCACGDQALFSQRLIDGNAAPYNSPSRCRENHTSPAAASISFRRDNKMDIKDR